MLYDKILRKLDDKILRKLNSLLLLIKLLFPQIHDYSLRQQ